VKFKISSYLFFFPARLLKWHMGGFWGTMA